MLNEEPELVPEYDQNLGFRYPVAEHYLTGPVTETLYIIRQLYEAGILLKKYRDKAVACPSCLSPAISMKYLCVACSSSNIEKRQIMEHSACGFSDVEESFLSADDWICPKCKKSVSRLELKDAATNFRCRSCGESFEKPTWMHNCKKCKLNFTLSEASFIDVYCYVLSEVVKEELEKGTVSISPIRMRFEELGFKVSVPSALKGKSGNLQPFDLLGTSRMGGKNVMVALDVVWSTDHLDVSPVSALMGKMIDTGIDRGFIVAIPGMNQAGKNLAELYDIQVIEANTAKEAADELEKRLRVFIPPR
jgi:DNA-directed RNA polymerase subunit RPC12/RpoP